MGGFAAERWKQAEQEYSLKDFSELIADSFVISLLALMQNLPQEY